MCRVFRTAPGGVVTAAMSLFDWDEAHAPVRRSDPETSRAALASVRMKDRKREVLAAMERLGRPCTASEIQQEMRRHQILRESGTIRSRLAQLKTDGVVYKTGGVMLRSIEDGGSGRAEQMWSLTGGAS